MHAQQQLCVSPPHPRKGPQGRARRRLSRGGGGARKGTCRCVLHTWVPSARETARLQDRGVFPVDRLASAGHGVGHRGPQSLRGSPSAAPGRAGRLPPPGCSAQPSSPSARPSLRPQDSTVRTNNRVHHPSSDRASLGEQLTHPPSLVPRIAPTDGPRAASRGRGPRTAPITRAQRRLTAQSHRLGAIPGRPAQSRAVPCHVPRPGVRATPETRPEVAPDPHTRAAEALLPAAGMWAETCPAGARGQTDPQFQTDGRPAAATAMGREKLKLRFNSFPRAQPGGAVGGASPDSPRLWVGPRVGLMQEATMQEWAGKQINVSLTLSLRSINQSIKKCLKFLPTEAAPSPGGTAGEPRPTLGGN